MSQQLNSEINISSDGATTDEIPYNNRLGIRVYLLIIGLLLLLTLFWIGRPEIVTRGEGREALVARSLFEQREFILPRGYGGVVPSKPPALHWFIGMSASLLGSLNEFACRLPSALTSLLFILFLASWVGRRDQNRVWPTVIVLATSFEWLRASVSCRVDMLHAAALAGAVIVGSGIFPGVRSTRVRWMVVVALSLISTLTKGPVGALLPAAILFIFGYWEHRRPFLTMISAGSIALGAINLAAIWYLAAYLQGGAEFIDKVSYENLQRFMSTMDDSPHRHSVWYLLGMGVLGFMPWSLPFLIQFARFISRGRVSSEAVTELVFSGREDDKPPLFVSARLWTRKKVQFLLRESLEGWTRLISEPESRLSIVAILVLFTFYAIPSGKRGVYLLAAYPFGAILIGRVICDYHEIRVKAAAVMTRIFALLVFGLTLILIGLSLPLKINFYPVQEQLNSLNSLVNDKLSPSGDKLDLTVNLLGLFSRYSWFDLGLVALIGLVLWIGLRRRGGRGKVNCHLDGSARGVFRRLALGYCCLLVLVQSVIFPAVTNSVGIRDIAKRIDEIIADSDSQGSSGRGGLKQTIYSYGSELYSVAFYSNNLFKPAAQLVEASDFSGFRDGSWVALETRYLKRLQARLAQLKLKFKDEGAKAADSNGCFDVGETIDFKEQERLSQGRMTLVKISCKSS